MTENEIASLLNRLEVNVRASITFNLKDETPTPTEPPVVTPTPTEPPVDPPQFNDVSTVLFGPVTYDDYDLGLISQQSFEENLTNAGATHIKRASNSWSSNVSNSKKPQIIDNTFVNSKGETITKRSAQFTMVKGFGNQPRFDGDDQFYLPLNYRVKFNSTSKDTYYAYLDDKKGGGWNDLQSSDEFKLSALIMNYDDNLSVKPTTSEDYDFAKHKIMGKGVNGSKELRYVTYPAAGFHQQYIIKTLHDFYPNIEQIYKESLDETQGPVLHVLRMVLNDVPSEKTAFLEYFINKKLVYRLEDYPVGSGEPFMLRDGEYYNNGINMSYHWGGNADTHPDNADAQLVYWGDTVWEYNEEWEGSYYLQKSPSDRVLVIPDELDIF